MKRTNLAFLAISFFYGAAASADPVLDFPAPVAFDGGSTAPAPAVQSVADAMTEMAEDDPNIALTNNEAGDVTGMVMLSDVLFGYDEAALTAEAIDALRAVASKLSADAALEVVGHTDGIGSQEFNLALGQARAEAVRAWLVTEGGLSATAIQAASAGKAEPIAANRTADGRDNPEGRALNRRVAFRIVAPVAQAAPMGAQTAALAGPLAQGPASTVR